MAREKVLVQVGGATVVSPGPRVERELPADAKSATDWFQSRIVGRAAGAGVTDKQSVAIRHHLKALRKWDKLSRSARTELWAMIHGYLAGELQVAPDDLLLPISPAIGTAVVVKQVHELSARQRADLSIRKRASALIAQGVAPVEILRLLEGKRSRAWLSRLAKRIKAGDADLLDRRTGNVGVKRYRETPRLLLESLAFDPLRKPAVTTIHKRLRMECEKLGATAPSIGWVRLALKSDPQLKLLHDVGREDYRRRYRPTVIGKDRDVPPGDIYEIDSTSLDIWVRVQRTDGEWEAIRPSLTCVIDVGSRAVVGMHLTLGNPTQASVCQAFLHAVLPKADPRWPMHGKPRALRLDRGAEYGTDFVGSVEACGVTVEWSPPHYPDARGKGERFFGSLNTFIHGLPATTSAIGTGEEFVHRRMAAMYDVEGLIEAIHTWITWDYHQSVHRGTNATPERLWWTGAHTHQATDEEIAAMLPYWRTVTVTHGHIDIQVDARRCQFMAAFLASHLGQKVSVRWMDLDCVHVFDAGTNRYLGVAVAGTHELAREVADEIMASRRQVTTRLSAHHKRATARYLSDASMTPTVQRQLGERVQAARDAQEQPTSVEPAKSEIERSMQALMEDRYK